MLSMEIRNRENAAWRLLGKAKHLPEFTAVVSVSNPGDGPPKGFEEFSGPKLALEFADVEKEGEWQWEGRATEAQVQEVIDFAESVRDAPRVLLHCNAGESRSTAVAFVLQCVLNWESGKEWEAMSAVGRATIDGPCNPNLWVVGLADKLLNREGQMFGEAEETKAGLKGMYSFQGF